MNTKSKTIFFILLPVLILAAVVAVYYLRQPDSVKSMRSAYQISSRAINKEFLMNDSLASIKYSSKIIEVSGPVANIKKSDAHGIIITMDDAMMGMKCVLDTTIKTLPTELNIGSAVKIKGVLIGFDPMVGLMMNQCFVMESKTSEPSTL